MTFLPAWVVLPAAFLLDLCLGDPRFLPHPIRWMGKAIEGLEPSFRKLPLPPTVSGAIFAAALVLCTWATTVLLLLAAQAFHPVVKIIIEIVLIYYCISAQSLQDAAMDVSRSLAQKQLKAARTKVALIVGRDVDDYQADGIARAAVETVSENLVDGVISPLFFAAIGGAPLAMAYKMVNTLDSMIGYKNQKYLYFGRAAAWLDDVLNYVPARNAGLPEAAFAGALAVKLNGPNLYNGKLVDKPYIGVRFGKAKIENIKQSCDIMMLSSILWLGIVWGINIAFS
jgi:adenosylcobinamide-phosphate synthase